MPWCDHLRLRLMQSWPCSLYIRYSDLGGRPSCSHPLAAATAIHRNCHWTSLTKRSGHKEGLNMYGLLLINMQDYVTKVFGAKQYEEVREALKIKDVSITSIMLWINFFRNFVISPSGILRCLRPISRGTADQDGEEEHANFWHKGVMVLWEVLFLPAAKPAGQWMIIGVLPLPVKFCERSCIRAMKTLEPRLLMPLSSNLISEVIQALRNWTLLSQYSTKEAKEALRLRLFRPLHSLTMTNAD